ncbi:MAG: hypothetical protein HYW50_00455, partial [Candidatus Diapherotrites archaeon]|nr:hypothetical protein [Candidatus Diapherotrites archaeon]
KFTTWAKVWFDSFALSYIPNLLRREKAEQGYRLGVQKAQPKYAKLPPRGYGLIPANIRSIWRLLGLRLETSIRFGPDETATAVSYIAHEAGLTKKQENVITLLLEGIPENNAGKRIGITVQAVNSLKLSAIGRMKKFIEEKRNNSAH